MREMRMKDISEYKQGMDGLRKEGENKAEISKDVFGNTRSSEEERKVIHKREK